MQDLHLIGVHEDGEHLLLGGDSGGEFRLRLDEALRRAARHEPRPTPEPGHAVATLGPREVQAMIRAGASPEEAAERAGWSVEKVHRFDAPILAERGHIAALAVATRLRGRYGEPSSTLAERVTERLHARGVALETLAWDSWRSEDGHWTVVASYTAGGRAREASWEFSRQGGTVHPLDDEALWLSADEEQDGPIGRRPTGPSQARGGQQRHDDDRPPRTAAADAAREPGGRDGRHTADAAPAGAQAARAEQNERRESTDARGGRADAPAAGGAPFEIEQHADPFDLMDSVRQHSGAQRRRGAAGRRTHRESAPQGEGHVGTHAASTGTGTSPTALPPVAGLAGDAALPLADLGYDPEIMTPPPGAHSHPEADGADGRPEPAAAEAAARRRGGATRARRTSRVAPPRHRPAEAAEPEPVRTKRRRPAAFPGALDPDPVTEDVIVAEDVIEEGTGAAVETEGIVSGDAAPGADPVAGVDVPDTTPTADSPDATPVAADADRDDSLDSSAAADGGQADDTLGDADASEAGETAVQDEPQLPWDEGAIAGSETPPVPVVTAEPTADPGPDAAPPAAGAGTHPAEAAPAEVVPEAAPAEVVAEAAPAEVVAEAAPAQVFAEAAPAEVVPEDAAQDTGEGVQPPQPPATDAESPADEPPTRAADEPQAADEPPARPAPVPTPPPGEGKAAASKRRGRPKGRASVPSWDDIMFGSRKE